MNIAHSSPDGRVQPLESHLQAVSALCAQYASAFGAEDLARLIGLCHDLGKYSAMAQRRMHGQEIKVDHSTAGAKEIYKLFSSAPYLAYPILGHHGGLPDGGGMADVSGMPTLFGRLKKDVADYSFFSKEINLFTPQQPKFSPLPLYSGYEGGFSVAFFVRMLFSCLVDADFLDTEYFMSAGGVERGGYADISQLHSRLVEFTSSFFEGQKEIINQKRTEILRSCISMAGNPPGLFTLTVPTGGGKTISSLAFALHHAKKHGKKRVIYVIPYTNILEQNSAVFAKIVGDENVLTHYSGAEYENNENGGSAHYLATENWDCPVIVTTNVQFFESLFAAKPSKCRKLHNICDSVIIFDEAQMLPTPYLLPCTRVIAELVHQYQCTAVLCSATQPALHGFFPESMQSTEISPDVKGLYNVFRRTIIQNIGRLCDDALQQRLNELDQVLCIVNTRTHAQALYAALEGEGNYHLSTLQYPHHRRQILEEIRKRLDAGKTCRVVSTSLVEAGVDLDFSCVYRARAGLDSIVQAAGRCNREGKRSAQESVVYVFDEREEHPLPISQHLPAQIFDSVAGQVEDLGSPQAIEAYFSYLYNLKGEQLDKDNIVAQFDAGAKHSGSFPFSTVADHFHLIDQNTRSILIPLGDGAAIADRLRGGVRNRTLLRQAAGYIVNTYSKHFEELLAAGAISVLDDQLALLADLSQYQQNTGLRIKPETGYALFAH